MALNFPANPQAGDYTPDGLWRYNGAAWDRVSEFDQTAYFQTALKFAELDTPQKKVDARTNLELQYIDCGTFN